MESGTGYAEAEAIKPLEGKGRKGKSSANGNGAEHVVAQLGGKPEITRFKGLGEISPKEFSQFIGKDMRLSKVEYAPRAESMPILTFYMGRNTPERKDYIVERLVVPVED